MIIITIIVKTIIWIIWIIKTQFIFHQSRCVRIIATAEAEGGEIDSGDPIDRLEEHVEDDDDDDHEDDDGGDDDEY